MNLVIDIGNTRTKVALFENNTIKKQESFTEGDWAIIKKKMPDLRQNKVIISSVDDIKSKKIQTYFPDALFFSHALNLPISIQYNSAHVLGVDRIAAAIGAQFLFPYKNTLIIDLGSAITFDFLDANGQFLGGNISPGLHFRLKSLHQYTNKLPFIKPRSQNTLIGKNTEEAINNGVVRGIIYEIEKYIDEYQENYNNLTVILTGGDSYFFDKILKKTIFAEENLVLIGLNRILTYNDNNI